MSQAISSNPETYGSPRKIVKKLQSSSLLQGLANAGSSGIKTISKSIPFGQKRHESVGELEELCEEDDKEHKEHPRLYQQDDVWKTTSTDQTNTSKQVDDKLSALDAKKKRREMQRDQQSNHTTQSGEGFSSQHLQSGSSDDNNFAEFPLSFGIDDSKQATSKKSSEGMGTITKQFDVLKLHATSERVLNLRASDALSSSDDDMQNKKKNLEEKRRRYKTVRSDRVLVTVDSAPIQERNVNKDNNTRKLERHNSAHASSKLERTPEDIASRGKKSTNRSSNRRRSSLSASNDQTATQNGVSGKEKCADSNILKNNQSWSSESNLSVSEGSEQMEEEGASRSPVVSQKKGMSVTTTPSIRRRPLLQARKEQSIRNFSVSPKKSPKSPGSPRRNKIKSKTTLKAALNDATEDMFMNANEKGNDSFQINDLLIELEDDSSKQLEGSIPLEDIDDIKTTQRSENSQRNLNKSKSQLLRTPSRRVRKPMHLAKDRVASNRGVQGQGRSLRQLVIDDGDVDDGEKQNSTKVKRKTGGEKSDAKQQIVPSSKRDELRKSLSMSSVVELESKPSIIIEQEPRSKRDFFKKILSSKFLGDSNHSKCVDNVANTDNRRDLFTKSSSAKLLTNTQKNNLVNFKTKEKRDRELDKVSQHNTDDVTGEIDKRIDRDRLNVHSLPEATNDHDAVVGNDKLNELFSETTADVTTKLTTGKSNFFKSVLPFRSGSHMTFESDEFKEDATLDVGSSDAQQTKSLGFSTLSDAQRKLVSTTQNVAEGLLNLTRWKGEVTTQDGAETDAELLDGVIINKKPFSEESHIYERNGTVFKDTEIPIFDVDDTEDPRRNDDGQKHRKPSSRKTPSERKDNDKETSDGHRRKSKKSEPSNVVKDGKEKDQNARRKSSSQPKRQSTGAKSTRAEGNETEDVTDVKLAEVAAGSMDESAPSKPVRHKVSSREKSRRNLVGEDAPQSDVNSSDNRQRSSPKTSRNPRPEYERSQSKKDKQGLNEGSNHVESQPRHSEGINRQLQRSSSHRPSQRHLSVEKEPPKAIDDNGINRQLQRSSSHRPSQRHLSVEKEPPKAIDDNQSKEELSTSKEKTVPKKNPQDSTPGKQLTSRHKELTVVDIGNNKNHGVSRLSPPRDEKSRNSHTNDNPSGQRVTETKDDTMRRKKVDSADRKLSKKSHQSRSRRNLSSEEEEIVENLSDVQGNLPLDDNSNRDSNKKTSHVRERSKSSHNKHDKGSNKIRNATIDGDAEGPKKELSSEWYDFDAVNEAFEIDAKSCDYDHRPDTKGRESTNHAARKLAAQETVLSQQGAHIESDDRGSLKSKRTIQKSSLAAKDRVVAVSKVDNESELVIGTANSYSAENEKRRDNAERNQGNHIRHRKKESGDDIVDKNKVSAL